MPVCTFVSGCNPYGPLRWKGSNYRLFGSSVAFDINYTAIVQLFQHNQLRELALSSMGIFFSSSFFFFFFFFVVVVVVK